MKLDRSMPRAAPPRSGSRRATGAETSEKITGPQELLRRQRRQPEQPLPGARHRARSRPAGSPPGRGSDHGQPQGGGGSRPASLRSHRRARCAATWPRRRCQAREASSTTLPTTSPASMSRCASPASVSGSTRSTTPASNRRRAPERHRRRTRRRSPPSGLPGRARSAVEIERDAAAHHGAEIDDRHGCHPACRSRRRGRRVPTASIFRPRYDAPMMSSTTSAPWPPVSSRVRATKSSVR